MSEEYELKKENVWNSKYPRYTDCKLFAMFLHEEVYFAFRLHNTQFVESLKSTLKSSCPISLIHNFYLSSRKSIEAIDTQLWRGLRPSRTFWSNKRTSRSPRAEDLQPQRTNIWPIADAVMGTFSHCFTKRYWRYGEMYALWRKLCEWMLKLGKNIANWAFDLSSAGDKFAHRGYYVFFWGMWWAYACLLIYLLICSLICNYANVFFTSLIRFLCVVINNELTTL